MSINHFSPDIPEALWWTQQNQQQQQHHHHHQQSMNMEHNHHQNTSLNFNLNQYDDVVEEDEEEDHKKNNELSDVGEGERETMFEKPLTPSDVGKLNRLVIPKQHAEKYFPLNNHNHHHHHNNSNGGGGGDSVSGGENKGGLLLSFEDESGKWWRFRYSYWNSSQSYVLTKGWSRYVKEKSLYAGDVVLFERHRSDLDRFFIGWRRRDTPPPHDSQQPTLGGGGNNGGGSSSSGGGGWTRVFYSAHPYPSHPFPFQPDCLHAGSMEMGETKTTPVGNSKRLIRLFGVNMECEEDESELSTSVSNQNQDHQGQGEPQNVHNYSYYNPETHGYPIHHNHMIQDVNFSRDVNQMINRRG